MKNENKIIVVCSKNKAKNEAVKNIMEMFFDNFEIITLETNSGVSETPIGDEEGLTGCHNRIKDAQTKINDANLYVAMEGILCETTEGTFLCGWTVIFDNECDKYLYGCSSKIRIPDEIIKNTSKEQRLSDVVAKYFNCTGDEISNIGTNGILTHGAYTRTDEFMDSILCAISSEYKVKTDINHG